jgi:hypothetical protein
MESDHDLIFYLSMISAQTLRACGEGKPVSTFPDHAPGQVGDAAVVDSNGRVLLPVKNAMIDDEMGSGV